MNELIILMWMCWAYGVIISFTLLKNKELLLKFVGYIPWLMVVIVFLIK